MKTSISWLAALALLSSGAALADNSPGQGSTMGHDGSTMSNGKTAATDTSTSKAMSNKKSKRPKTKGTGSSDPAVTPQPTAKSGAAATSNSDAYGTPGK